MDSEGIWKAWTMKVMANTAITTVESSDCKDVSQDSFGADAGAGETGCGCNCSGAASVGIFNRLSLARWDAGADAPTPAARPAVQPVFWLKRTRAQHIQDFRRSAEGCAPPP